MISDEELFDLMLSVDQNTKRIPPGIRLLADAIYQLGRQHQRESDAALCEEIEKDAVNELSDSSEYVIGLEHGAARCISAIRNNTGELK